jgi:hypothetical protein
MSGDPTKANLWTDADVYVSTNLSATLPADADTPFGVDWAWSACSTATTDSPSPGRGHRRQVRLGRHSRPHVEAALQADQVLHRAGGQRRHFRADLAGSTSDMIKVPKPAA